jgi:hypothetical protein
MLGLFHRRPRLPAAKRPALDRDERVLAWADAPEEQVVIATNRGLWLPGQPLLGWHEVHKAAWSGRELRVTAAEVAAERDDYTVVVDRPLEAVLLLEPREVPDQVRSRVTRSVAYTSHHPLPGGGVRIVARRVPGVDGLRWTARYDTGTAAEAESVVRATDALVTRAREVNAPPV